MASAPDPNDALTTLINGLRAQVLRVQAVPPAQRDAELLELWRKHHAAGVHNGMSLQEAARMADQLEGWVRTALKTTSSPALESTLKH